MMSLADLHPPEEDFTAVFPSSSAATPVLDIVFVCLVFFFLCLEIYKDIEIASGNGFVMHVRCIK